MRGNEMMCPENLPQIFQALNLFAKNFTRISENRSNEAVG